MKKRRILAMVLSLAMVMTAVPVSVFGEEADALIEDEVLVEEAVQPVEAAPEEEAPAEEVETPVEEPAPADELIIEDAVEDVEVPAETEATPEEEAEAEFIDILEDVNETEGHKVDAVGAQSDKSWDKLYVQINDDKGDAWIFSGSENNYNNDWRYGGDVEWTLDVSKKDGNHEPISVTYDRKKASEDSGIVPKVFVSLEGTPIELKFKLRKVDNESATWKFSDETPVKDYTPARCLIDFEDPAYGDIYINFQIEPKKITAFDNPTGNVGDTDYTGKPHLPSGLQSLKLTDGDTLEYGKDFLCYHTNPNKTHDDCLNAGKHIGRFFGIYNYTGSDAGITGVYNFDIRPKLVQEDDIELAPEQVFYLHTATGGSTVPYPNCEDENLQCGGLFEYLWKNVLDSLTIEEDNRALNHNKIEIKYYRDSDTLFSNVLGSNQFAPGSMGWHNGAQTWRHRFEYTPGRYAYVVEFTKDDWYNFYTNYTDENSFKVIGYYTIKEYPDLESIKDELQKAVDKKTAEPSIRYALTYDGRDKKSFVEGEIVSWINEVFSHVDMDAKISATCNVDSMIDVDSYDFTIRNLREGDELGEDSIVLHVNVYPREMARNSIDTSKFFYGNEVGISNKFKINVEQWLHSDGKYSQKWPAKVQIMDLGIYNANGTKPGNGVLLTEGEDYVWSVDKRDPNTGAIKSIKITGKNNYVTSVGPDDKLVDAEYDLPSEEVPTMPSLAAPFISMRVKSTYTWDDKEGGVGGSVVQNIPASDIEVKEEKDNGEVIDVNENDGFFVYGYDPEDYEHPTSVNDGFPASAGRHYVVIKGKGIWSPDDKDNRAAEFHIVGRDMTMDLDFRNDIPDQEMLVDVLAPTPSIYLKDLTVSGVDILLEKYNFIYTYWHYDDNGKKVVIKSKAGKSYVKGSDFGPTLTDETTLNFPTAGEYYVSVTFNRAAVTDTWMHENLDDYTSYDVKFIVNKRNIGDKTKVSVSVDDLEWPGAPVTSKDLNIHVRDIEKKRGLTEGKDFSVRIEPNDICSKDVIVIVEGQGDYTGEQSVNIEVWKRVLTNDKTNTRLTVNIKTVPYIGGSPYNIPGKNVKVEILNPQGEWVTVDPSEYVFTFKRGVSAVEVGHECAVVVTGAENHYTGTVECGTVTIAPLDIGETDYVEVLPIEDQAYTGSEIRPDVTLQYAVGGLSDAQKVIDPSNYEVSYSNNTEAGTADVAINATGANFTGSTKATFKITPLESTLKATIDKEKILTTETAKITVTGAVGKVSYVQAGTGKVSIADDGTVTGVTAGDVTITVKEEGDNNHVAGSVDLALKVEKKAEDIGTFTATVEGGPFVYNKQKHEPHVAVMSDGKSLTEGTDYVVTYADNTNAGEATYTVEGKNAYAGTIIGHFTIQKAKNAITKAKSATKYYSTSVQKTKKMAGAKADSGAVTYASDNAQVTVDAKTGEVTIPAKFMGRANITITASDPNYETATATVTLTVQPKKVKLNSVKMDKGKARLKWTKAPDCSGYVVKISSSSTFKSDVEYVWVKKENASTTRFIKHMQKGKTYYFKVKVYKNIPGQKKVYSKYSNSKKLTIK